MKKQSLFYVVLVVLSLFLAINTNVLGFFDWDCGTFEGCYYFEASIDGECHYDRGPPEIAWCDTENPEDCNEYQMLFCCEIDPECKILDK